MAIKTHSKHFIFINFSNFHRNFIQFSKLWIDSSFWCVFYNMYTWLRWLNQPTATRTNNQMLYENHAWFASSWIILIRFISWESKSHAQILQNMIAVRPIINQTEGFLRKPKKRPSLVIQKISFGNLPKLSRGKNQLAHRILRTQFS